MGICEKIRGVEYSTVWFPQPHSASSYYCPLYEWAYWVVRIRDFALSWDAHSWFSHTATFWAALALAEFTHWYTILDHCILQLVVLGVATVGMVSGSSWVLITGSFI